MAFPIPAHLPRKKDAQDVSTQILTKVSETPLKSLNSQLASSWVAELDDAIAQTKSCIHERISNDLPAFNEQLSSAKSIQERLRSLTANVDTLSDGLSNPESGLIPRLVVTLSQHAQLAHESLDADIKSRAVSHLLRCKKDYSSLAELVYKGQLPDAVKTCVKLEAVFSESPDPLARSVIMGELQRSFRAMQARTEEQLSDAYSRGLTICSSELVIRPAVQVRQSETILSLSSVLSSLSNTALASHLSSLRRDIVSHYIEYLMKQPASVVVSDAAAMTGNSEHKLVVYPAPPETSDLSLRIDNLATALTFLTSNFLSNLPTPDRTSFALSLCRPTRDALLYRLLIPSLPSSLELLPGFLQVVDHACQFEEKFVCTMLGDSDGEQGIRIWAGAVSLHYERKRRMELLEAARVKIMAAEDESRTFYVDLQIATGNGHSVPAPASAPNPEPIEEESEAAWGFDDDKPTPNDALTSSQSQNAPTEEANGWDFDDDVEPERQDGQPEERSTESTDENAGGAWGWNDDDDASETLNGDDSFDNPWNDSLNEDSPLDKGANSKPASIPKPAKRLEKLSSKGKRAQAGAFSPSVQSPALVPPPPPTPMMPAVPQRAAPAVPSPPPQKESYMASGRVKDLLQHMQHILDEAAKLVSSGVFNKYPTSQSASGLMLVQAAPLTLDLYRAMYPVRFANALRGSPKRSMRFSNDCIYMGGEVEKIASAMGQSLSSVKASLKECSERLETLGSSWFEETLDRQCQGMNEILDEAGNFVETTDQERFDECENAVTRALQRVRQLAQQWKPVLNKSKYYDAVGLVLDAALSRILSDILALPDITEVESHRLSELCRILNATEGLFVEDPEQPSFIVAYVPSWLKYSYLSELLEASIADISYLFDEGALVDFEIEELVKLVQALFADTPLRANAIHKLLHGYPVPSQ
ncbi:uncharacterized protein LAESUDRAFT_651560 [Laetiporus sulphureus 93-53]|uniref:ZW10 C-terminal helical domain-containing protein n=1 Tax=Laetiporus sulphureus 93-53 TaxID=1314785 RepID=A0A165EL48_9APHY|nr:uncharacterized protein LAESUDRAFT_651560 [Laetiporus sulphureus 93-53]KZT07285.1 hypothetical protein LAESUDRAFT_651560 [Laetiporus sulphureus 93-53]